MARGSRIVFALILAAAFLVAGGQLLPGAGPVSAAQESQAAITDPRVDPNAALLDAIDYASNETPAAGPLQGSYDLASGQFQYLSAGVSLQYVYAQYSYVVPPNDLPGNWLVGFTFWGDPGGTVYDLFVRDWNGDLKWGVGASQGGAEQIFQSGDVDASAIDTTPGHSNQLSLVVSPGTVMLANNSKVLAVYTMQIAKIGDVSAEVGFLADDQSTTQTVPMSLSQMYVWDLGVIDVATPGTGSETTVATPSSLQDQLLTQIFEKERLTAMANTPIYADEQYSLVQHAGGNFDFIRAGAGVADFYMTVTFVNPSDMSTTNDFGVGFRLQGDGSEFRFMVRSDGRWGFAVGSEQATADGTVTNVDPNPGASNTIEIVAKGASGILVVNGVVVQQVDLSSNLNPGDVYIASGMYPADQVEGRIVPYTNFDLYRLDS